MGIYDGDKAANETLLEVAKLSLMAAMKAPQMTGKVVIRGEILTGEDTLPVIEALEAQAGVDTVPGLPYGDARTLRTYYDAGDPAVILLLGSASNMFRSELNWDCNACGFKTCAEFNAYSRQIRKAVESGQPLGPQASGTTWRAQMSAGSRQVGPTCVWKVMDFASACSWAAAACWQYNVDNRIQGTTAGAARMVGYLPGCNQMTSIVIGPCRDFVYYNRPAMKHGYSAEDFRDFAMKALPQLWATFPGGGNPTFKYADDWQTNPRYLRWVEEPPSPELLARRQASQQKILAIRQRVEAKRKALQEGAAQSEALPVGKRALLSAGKRDGKKKRSVEDMIAEELANPGGQDIRE